MSTAFTFLKYFAYGYCSLLYAPRLSPNAIRLSPISKLILTFAEW
ncbi:hypothetical protein ACEN2P_05840 [Pedobacter psychrotolerans]